MTAKTKNNIQAVVILILCLCFMGSFHWGVEKWKDHRNRVEFAKIQQERAKAQEAAELDAICLEIVAMQERAKVILARVEERESRNTSDIPPARYHTEYIEIPVEVESHTPSYASYRYEAPSQPTDPALAEYQDTVTRIAQQHAAMKISIEQRRMMVEQAKRKYFAAITPPPPEPDPHEIELRKLQHRIDSLEWEQQMQRNTQNDPYAINR